MARVHRWQIGVAGALFGMVAVILVAAGGASAVTVLAGNLKIEISGHSTPTALPRDEFVPIGFSGAASVSTRDGTHIPPALGTELLVDKHIRLDTTGLPTCSPGQLQSASPAEAMKACGDALIGRGVSTAQVQFPEQAPFDARGPLLAFNGPSSGGGAYGGSGYNKQLYYVYANVPLPTALVATGKVEKASGKYGYKISITIPKIAGGSGSFKSAEFTINRRWRYKGAKHSFLNAECANGHFAAQVKVAFGDGTDLSGIVFQSCKTTAGVSGSPSGRRARPIASRSAGPGPVVRRAFNPQLGETILIGARGRTLYSLSAERHGRFICTGACESTWRPLVVPAGVKPEGPVVLGTRARPDGRNQVTFEGLPLYAFAGDSASGQVKGEGIKDVGTWHAAVAAGRGG